MLSHTFNDRETGFSYSRRDRNSTAGWRRVAYGLYTDHGLWPNVPPAVMKYKCRMLFLLSVSKHKSDDINQILTIN